MSRLLATVCCLVSLIACASAPRWPPPRTAADGDVLVALAALALDDWTQQRLPAAVCCLEVHVGRSSVALLAGLPASSLPVLDRSQCRKSYVAGGYSYKARSDGARAVLLQIAIDRWLDPTTVMASYGWDHSTFAARSRSVRLGFRDDRWVVTEVPFDVQSKLCRPTPACGGVAPDSEVTESQAVCIATLAGFAPGLKPWTVREEFYPAQRLASWLVFNTLNGDPCDPKSGEVMHISKTGGAVVMVRSNFVICDPLPVLVPDPVPVLPAAPELPEESLSPMGLAGLS